MKKLKALAVFFIALLIVSGMNIPVSASGKKAVKTYDIAVVYDNSGSMYTKGNLRWCRAQYAMEIFASMLDFSNGDKLAVFPMWPVTTDGSAPNRSGDDLGRNPSVTPITVKTKSDIEKIHNMYTPVASGTPFIPVNEAYGYLRSSSADEKWLIILTDGAFNQTTRDVNDLNAPDVTGNLNSFKDVKIEYIGLDTNVSEIKSNAKNFTVTDSRGDGIRSDLISICNKIFQRSVLPAQYINGQTLDFDISMSKIIVFVQGNGAKIEGLSGANGKVAVIQDSGQRSYCTVGKELTTYLGKEPLARDTSLAGQVTTFGQCSAGKYSLSLSGVDDPKNVQIFYEPDVSISIELRDSDGKVIDTSSGKINEGEYTIHYALVDSVTNKDITGHSLMGDVNISAYVSKSNGQTAQYKNGDTIKLEPDEGTSIIVRGTYLKDYTITSEGTNAISLPLKVDFEELPHLSMSVLGPTQPLKSSLVSEWQKIRVEFSLDGKPLTDEQLNALSLSQSISPSMKYQINLLNGQSAAEVTLSYDGGTYSVCAPGQYTFSSSASMLDEHGREINASCQYTFTVVDKVFTVSVENKQPAGWYTIIEQESWKPIRVDLLFDGQPLTAEQFEALDLEISFSGDIPYSLIKIPGESAYEVNIGRDEQGNFVKPETGGYKITVKASMKDEVGRDLTATDSADFNIALISRLLIFLIVLLILLLIAAIVFWWMSRKVLPKNILLKQNSTRYRNMGMLVPHVTAQVNYSRKTRTLSVSTPSSVPYNKRCSASFTLEPVDRRWTKSKSRHILITGITSGDANKITVQNIPFVYDQKTGTIKNAIGAQTQQNNKISLSALNAIISITNRNLGTDAASLNLQLEHK